MNKQQPIIIAGLYRGGTSLTAGIFQLCGAWMGRTVAPNSGNRKGYFEHIGLKGLLEIMLGVSGFNDSDSLPPDDLIGTRPAHLLGPLLEQMIVNEGYQGGAWAIKNPKIAFFWPYFNQAYPSSKWIVVRRNLDEVAASMMRMNPLSVPPQAKSLTADGLRQVVEQYDSRLDRIVAALGAARVREVNSNEIVAGDLDRLKRAIEWSGLEFQKDAVLEFIEPTYFSKVDSC